MAEIIKNRVNERCAGESLPPMQEL
jgi:hypothetical protein